MTSHRILQLNAVSTAACGFGMLATRGTLHSFFGLDTPALLDLLALGLVLYAGALAFAEAGVAAVATGTRSPMW